MINTESFAVIDRHRKVRVLKPIWDVTKTMVILRKDFNNFSICEYADNFVLYCDILPDNRCDLGMFSSTLLYVRECLWLSQSPKGISFSFNSYDTSSQTSPCS